MKANEAPERLYLSDFTDTTESVFYVKQDNTKKTDIEYIRKDAFIEKTLEWISKEIRPYYSDVKYKYEDFKKYMEGE